MLTILRQPRYLGLCALMALLALVCSAAGTWQIFRFEQKHRANHQLRLGAVREEGHRNGPNYA